jgi:hypothetical protein
VVVACVYTGWIPPEIAAQLPENHNAQSWAAEIERGKIVRLRAGPPEKVAAELVAAKP